MSPKSEYNPVTGLIKDLSKTAQSIENKGLAEIPASPFSITDEQVLQPPQTHTASTDFVLNKIAALNKLKDSILPHINTSSLNEELVFSLLENATQISMVARDAYIGSKDADYSKRRERFVSGANIEITQPEQAILRVSLPPLIGRRFKGSYDIYWSLKYALEEYFSTHNVPQFKDEKLFLIYKKYGKNLTVSYTCDNDNWEAKRTTNAISEAINYSDNADHFSFIYTAVKSTTNYVEATLIKAEDLPLFCHYLTDNNPSQPL